MSYVNSVIAPGEDLIHTAKVSKFIYLPAFLGMAAMLAWPFVPLMEPFAQYKDEAAWALLAYTAYTLATAFITRTCSELAVTERRVIAKFGLIRRHTFEISIPRIETIEINQTILGRIFNFGIVLIKGTGSGIIPLPSIDAPLEFQRAVGVAMERAPQE